MAGWPGVRTGSRRRIGPGGTAARVAVGGWFVSSVILGRVRAGSVNTPPVLLGLVGFPAVVLAWHWWRVRRSPTPFQYTSPLSFSVNAIIFFALWLTWWYAPPLRITSDAALTFYGMSMLVAALNGDDGCEVLAISNWILRRDDQVGCALFFPVDHAETRLREAKRAGQGRLPARLSSIRRTSMSGNTAARTTAPINQIRGPQSADPATSRKAFKVANISATGVIHCGITSKLPRRASRRRTATKPSGRMMKTSR